MTKRLTAFVALLVLLIPGVASAAVIEVLGPVSPSGGSISSSGGLLPPSFTVGGGAGAGAEVAAFDPTLGLLQSVELLYSGSFSVTGSAGVTGAARISASYAGIFTASIASDLLVSQPIGSFSIGAGPGSECPCGASVSVPTFAPMSFLVDNSMLSAFIGTGSVFTNVFVSSLVTGTCDTTGGAGSCTASASASAFSPQIRARYTYTPATAVPEPGTLLLLAAGLMGLALSRRPNASNGH